MTGQSNANPGSTHGPALSLEPVYPDNVYAPNGPLLGDLVDNAEWPGAALGVSIYERALAGGANKDRQYCIDPAGGLGGMTLLGLSKQSVIFKQNVNRIADAAARANDNRRHMIMASVHLIQGESDERNHTSQAAYSAQMRQLLADYTSGAKGRTGQVEDLIMFVDQVNDWDFQGLATPTIGLYQLEEAISNPAIVMVGPRYQFEGHTIDDEHYSSIGYQHLGELHAKAFDRVINGGVWEPLRMSEATLGLEEAEIIVRFVGPDNNGTLPYAPIVFDIVTVPQVTNMGFSYVDDSESPPSILSVTVKDDGVSIGVLLDAIPSGANPKIQYGFVSQYGNVRDSDPDRSRYDNVPLHNWCCHSQIPIAIP